MQYVYPDYYKEFKCIAGDCKHTCCQGWEVDIDPETYHYYHNIRGEFGKKLKKYTTKKGIPHFIMDEHDRCPFLNKDGLCDVFIELGEEHLCQICTEHPRFKNKYDDRLETGLGLCCEEAGRIILGKKDPVKLVIEGESDVEDKLLDLRDEVTLILQDRSLSIDQRMDKLLVMCKAKDPRKKMPELMQAVVFLERMDEKWTELLNMLFAGYSDRDEENFNTLMQDRQTEYEQLLVYFVYRHLGIAFDEIDIGARAAFAVFGCTFIRNMGIAFYKNFGHFDFEDHVEIARLFSAEIEYSEENLEAMIEELE